MTAPDLTELERAAREAKAAQERFSAVNVRYSKGNPSEDLKREWARAMALAEVDTDTFRGRATPELILELIAAARERDELKAEAERSRAEWQQLKAWVVESANLMRRRAPDVPQAAELFEDVLQMMAAFEQDRSKAARATPEEANDGR